MVTTKRSPTVVASIREPLDLGYPSLDQVSATHQIPELEYPKDVLGDGQALLFGGSCLDGLQHLREGCVDLVVTSPPYNMGRAYESIQPLDDYLAEICLVVDELQRVLARHGSICWQVGNYVRNGESYPLDYLYYKAFAERGFILRNRIVWHFEHGLNASNRFSGRYEMILWFTKGAEYKFNLDPVRVPAKYPGKLGYKGPNKGKPTCNPLGKNPGDVWKVLAHDWETLLWEIPNVKANHPEKTEHPCQFPIELAERCVLALSEPGGLIVDPFAGSGSALLAAFLNGRKSFGCESYSAYIPIIEERLKQAKAGTLRRRRLGTPVAPPAGKVAMAPADWLQK